MAAGFTLSGAYAARYYVVRATAHLCASRVAAAHILYVSTWFGETKGAWLERRSSRRAAHLVTKASLHVIAYPNFPCAYAMNEARSVY